MARRIAVVTGSRADFGLLKEVLKEIRGRPAFELKLVVTGAHLSKAHGHTVDEIEREGFRVDYRIPLNLDDDSGFGCTLALGECTAGAARMLRECKPDLVLLLGDRYEILGVAQAAMLMNFPVAHIFGGDVTAGAFDEGIRHAISKMAHIHFPTHAEAAKRLCQMGEREDMVFDVGCTGLDTVRNTKLIPRAELERELNAKFGGRNILVTFHPVTRAEENGLGQMDELVAALDALDRDITLFITLPNADPGNKPIKDHWEALLKRRKNTYAYPSLGSLRYLSLVAQVDFVVGNSSSAIHEVPFLGKPSLDIGDRQEGRPKGESVLWAPAERKAILKQIDRLLTSGKELKLETVYGDGHSAKRIADALEKIPDYAKLLKKVFVDRFER